MSSPPSPQPDVVVKNRFLGFLIWQSFSSTTIYVFAKLFFFFFFAAPTGVSASQLIFSLLNFLAFTFSNLLFSTSLSTIYSPQSLRFASPLQFATAIVRFVFVSSVAEPDFRRRALVSARFCVFVVVAGVSGALSVLCLCGFDGFELIGRLGVRCFVFGVLYGLLYLYEKRWVLEFPIIQRPLFYSFKKGIPLAIKHALKILSAAYLFSVLLLVFVPEQFTSKRTIGQFITEQIILYIGSFYVILCWELNHHLHQVLQTKRLIFAPPKGSAAAETNPSEPLLAALEETIPNSLPQYLAYLDLCMVCEYNVDTWRRAAFFEETGETYQRVVAVCLRPLEQLASSLSEGLEGSAADKAQLISNQLQSPANSQLASKYYEPLNNFQKYAWCARAVASLTARSHEEDRFGVAQLTGGNAATISTLISCLLAVEAFMGKKTSLLSQHQVIGPAAIKWATPNSGRRNVVTNKKRGGPPHAKAYAMADVLKTSIYCIVSAFHSEMLISAKAGLLDKDWITKGKPHFVTYELLVQKLHHFLDFQAT